MSLAAVQEETEIIQTQAVEVEDDKKFNCSLLSKLKCENDLNCCQTSELKKYENTFLSFPIKKELEDSRDDFQHLKAVKVTLKEEIEREEHKLEWELLEGTSRSVETFRAEVDQSHPLEKNEIDRSLLSENEDQAKYNNCTHCPYKTNNNSYYGRHYLCQHQQCTEMYKCSECPHEAKIRSDLAKRYKNKHSKHSQGVYYKCDECSFQTRYKSSLTNHYNTRHGKEVTKYKCDQCSYETRYKRGLTHHYNCEHAKEAQVFKCEECSYKTTDKLYLAQHIRIHSEIYKCEECSYKTKWKSTMTQHYKYKHSKEAQVYSCHECSFETRYKRSLTVHCKVKHSKETMQSYKD